MATRALIGQLNPDKTVSCIYSHYDGYPEYLGVILDLAYKSPQAVSDLINLGSISLIGVSPTLVPPGGFKTNLNRKLPLSCIAYGRDRCEKDTGAAFVCDEKTYWDNDADFDVSYLYLFKNGHWYVKNAWSNNAIKNIYDVYTDFDNEDIDAEMASDRINCVHDALHVLNNPDLLKQYMSEA
jgi:hypothetical protein